MHDLLNSVPGEQLRLPEYQSDFQDHFWRVGEAGFWKLERRQEFSEPGNESWQAFVRGDWDESMRRLESQRSEIADYYRRIADHGFRTHRVRVVSKTITPYLRWELELLRLRSEFGAGMRVVREEQVEQFEGAEQLPELCALGTEVLYEVRYDADGVLTGGTRYRDPGLITRCRKFIRDLYEEGEDLATFLDRSDLVSGLR